MAQNRFASVPNISIPRSRFHQPFNHATSFQHGKLIPIDCFEVLPGDTYHLNLNSIIWMSNPIVPIFGNIKAYVHAFFVPMRLVWKHTEEFYGENKTTSGYRTTSYKIPMMNMGYIGDDAVSSYLGKPLGDWSSKNIPISTLKERGYYLIWNEYFRAQQLQNPVLVNFDGNGTTNGGIGTLSGVSLGIGSSVLNVNKEFDYFTAATLQPQYGPAVTLPLGTYAPVVTTKVSDLGDVPDAVKAAAKIDDNVLKWLSSGSISGGLLKTGGVTANGEYSNLILGDIGTVVGMDPNRTSYSSLQNRDRVVPANLAADLSQATAATINELRYAFAIQKYLERSNFGSRFFEMLSVHYGITSPDATLQLPQRLGSGTINIAVNTVLSTAGAEDGATTKLGQPGAVSCSARKDMSLFTKAFVEPGYLYVLIETKHERSYTQGLLREDTKTDRYQFYSPEFCNLGDQSVLNKEIFLSGSDGHDDDVFGYQEHWAEYRYRPQRVTGILNPQAANPLDFWTLAEDYSTRPQLDGNWIQEDRDALARCLVTGSSGPDYIADFYFDYTATREMPFFTIPGLIDHFGVM